MKITVKTTTALILCTALIAVSGCAQQNAPGKSTAAAAAAAETTEAATAETTEAVTAETTEAVTAETTEAATSETTEAATAETTEAATAETTETATAETTEAATAETTEAATTETTEAATAETTETSADDTEAADNDEQPLYDSDWEKHPFRLGVWLVKNREGSEDYDEIYYCFREGGGGSFLSQSTGIGMEFSYGSDGSETRYRFEIGEAGSSEYMEIVDADPGEDHFRAKWDDDDGILDWTYLCPSDGFSFYSNYSLGIMAEKLFGMSLESVENEIAETAFELGMISVIIRDPSVEDYAKSILKWYFIDRYTAKGYDSDGNPVDLAVLKGDWAEMPCPDSF